MLVNVGMSAVIIPLVIGGSSFAAKIAVNALIIDVIFSVYVFRIFICSVSHVLSPKSEGER